MYRVSKVTQTKTGRIIDQFYVGNNSETNTWYSVLNNKGEPVFFDLKFYKKGTVHIKFIDMKVWELLNRKYAEIKGQVLPEKI